MAQQNPNDVLSRMNAENDQPFIKDFAFFKSRFQKIHKSYKSLLVEFKKSLDRLERMAVSGEGGSGDDPEQSPNQGSNKKTMARQMLLQQKEMQKQVEEMGEALEQMTKWRDQNGKQEKEKTAIIKFKS